MFYQMDQKKRNFMRGYHKWPKATVPYTIDKSRIGKPFSSAFLILFQQFILHKLKSHIAFFHTDQCR